MNATVVPILGPLLADLRTQLPETGRTWLDAALATAERGSRPELLRLYTGAAVRAGRGPFAASEALRQAAAGVVFERWTIEDAVRAALLLSRATVAAEDEFVLAATACYEEGDASEQQSWLRAVALLPCAARFVALVVDACRTNILPLFEAIACEGPFPARHFPERGFNQMVLKALFNGVPLERIAGLDTRLNPELSRMTDDYVSEREAAGRPVPCDIWLVLAPHAPGAAALDRVRRYLEHADPAHRRHAAAGLARREAPEDIPR
jgi:hypothetical protein